MPVAEGSKDLETVAKMDVAFNCEIFGKNCFFNEPQKVVSWLLSMKSKAPNLVLLAEEENYPKGHTIYSMKEDVCFVKSLYVVNDSRGKGIGSKLLDGVIKDTKSRELSCVYLVPSNNSKSFYKHKGFLQRTSESINGLFLSIV